ncbi:hypothetical protein [Sphingomonas sp.]|uniref:hypothetical protein n=1 Tax=Sphingomonas sp. TaxID=28214 RepID=UPI003B007149
MAGKFVFVPAMTEVAEDEGWLMGLVIEATADRPRSRYSTRRRRGAACRDDPHPPSRAAGRSRRLNAGRHLAAASQQLTGHRGRAATIAGDLTQLRPFQPTSPDSNFRHPFMVVAEVNKRSHKQYRR